MQEALVRAWRNPDVLTNGKGSTRGWLLTVVRNLVIDRVRAKAARPTEVAESPGPQPCERDHADRSPPRSPSGGARAALGGPSGVLEQLYFEGRSLGEAATALGVPTGHGEVAVVLRAARAAPGADRNGGVAT